MQNLKCSDDSVKTQNQCVSRVCLSSGILNNYKTRFGNLIRCIKPIDVAGVRR
jgi:hypothetical protein